MSAERLRRFFTKIDGGYRIAKTVRDLCIFARQDLARDPPFAKLDLVVCRNVLIYMSPALQNRLLTVFHYALKPSGYLMLGHAETIGSLSEFFAIEDKRHRIYKKLTSESAPPMTTFPVERAHASLAPTKRAEAAGHPVQHEADRIALERFAPPGVIVDRELQIVQFRGQTGAFLSPAPGDPTMNLLKMARDGLLHGLRAAFQAASKSSKSVRKDGLRVEQNGSWCNVGVEVIPMTASGRGHYLVLFHAQPPAGAPPKLGAAKHAAKRGGGREDERIRHLEAELAANREYLQSIIQEVEAANEELQSANEEILSSNEELQSTNEELDTAKEELQSTNEELNTLNEELHGRNNELSLVNSDLVNLLASIQIAIVIVANDLRIRRFTPMAERFLNLIASDIGRPIGHIKPNIDCPDLEQLITRAIDTVTPQEREVQDRQGNWFSLRVRPYKSLENRIDGAVLSLFDIQTSKVHDDELQSARRQADAIIDATPVPLVVLDASARIRRANQAFCSTFGYHPDGIASRVLFDVGNGSWNVPELREGLAAVSTNGTGTAELDLVHRFPDVGERTIRVRLRHLGGDATSPATCLLTVAPAAIALLAE